MKLLGLCAVFTCYKPSAEFNNTILRILEVCDFVVVVDNTPGKASFMLPVGAHLLQDGINKGLGKALNLGILAAKEYGCSHVLLLDQDTEIQAKNIVDLFLAHQAQDNTQLCLGPVLYASGTRYAPHDDVEMELPVSQMATSGMLFSLVNFKSDTLFSEEFFVDFVDYEWCWRVGKQGWQFKLLPRVTIPHQLGMGPRSFLGLKFNVPAPFRHYFQFRDTLFITRLSYAPVGLRLRLAMLLLLKFLVYPLILGDGRERIIWMSVGTRDFFSEKRGAGSAFHKIC